MSINLQFNATSNSDRICSNIQRIWSYGFYGNNHSIYYSVPVLLLQVFTFSFIMGIIRLLLSPFNQPRFVSDSIAGIIMGPSFLGSYVGYAEAMFPIHAQLLSDTLASMGIVYYQFVEGLKIDLRGITQAGRKEVTICLCGIVSGYMLSQSFILAMKGFLPDRVRELGFLRFVPIACGMSAFPDVQPVLEELGLLNTELGRLAMTLAMLNSAFGILVSLLTQCARHTMKSGLKYGVYTFVASCVMYMLLFGVARPVTLWVVRRTPKGRKVGSDTVVAFMVVTLVAGTVSDSIGAAMFQAPLLFAMLIPPGPPLGSVLVLKIETFLKYFLIPIFFIFNGRKFNVFQSRSWSVWWFMVFTVFFGCVGKIVGTMLTAKYYKIPNQESFTLALILCFRGVMLLLTFANWAKFGIIDGPTLASIQVATIMVTAITAPMVRRLARRSTKPLFPYNGRSMERSKPNGEFRLMMCIYDDDNVSTLLNLLNASNGTRASPINLCILHLVELVGRGAPILTAHNPLAGVTQLYPTRLDHIVRAFEKLVTRTGGDVALYPFTSVSPYKTMHQDVCALAIDKRVCLVIVPLHKHTIFYGEAADGVGRLVARNILYEAPCSVGVLLDRSKLRSHVPKWTATGQFSFRVGTVFLGGADDREALCYVSRMVENPGVSLLALRCLAPYSGIDHGREKLIDDEVVGEFRLKALQQEDFVYREEMVSNVEEMMNSIRSMGTDFDLIVVGRRHPAHSLIVDALSDWSECVELGVIGDFFASSDFAKGGASVLSIQQNRMIGSLVNIGL
ncbi:hypothetical protein H6P81_017040 [Aristolochia fimbriata]|uniref:Cation/H+ exchanger domain-containing protein n=1 Tax=Aristolochia fimbriata TaxID=158543 RepID=A0AAV7DYB1_ARIFI|nr:hypothetical protein H6P81_017040 [Aristolochia fimbriata]